jgi:hypothetical protein
VYTLRSLFLAVSLLIPVVLVAAKTPDEAYFVETLHAMVPLTDHLEAQLSSLVGQARQPQEVTYHDQCPLFEAYPGLQKAIPHITLTDLPTPIQKMDKLGDALGLSNLYVKRDDLCGFKQEDGSRANHVSMSLFLPMPLIMVQKLF